MTEQLKPVTKEQALQALDDLDDYVRTETGVDAFGPRECLRLFIDQQRVD